MNQDEWRSAAEDMLRRIDQTAGVLNDAFPHWANGQTGEWTTTRDGDWTGGAWPARSIIASDPSACGPAFKLSASSI